MQSPACRVHDYQTHFLACSKYKTIHMHVVETLEQIIQFAVVRDVLVNLEIALEIVWTSDNEIAGTERWCTYL
jgi:hypothetical protein